MNTYKDTFKRVEIKYLLTELQYKMILKYLRKIAVVDEYGLTRINNIYFDTPSYSLIRSSIEKPIYKEKLRLRTYGDTKDDSPAFIEIKKKYDGIVYKRRISGTYKDAYDYLTGKGEVIDKSQISKEIEAFKMTYPHIRPAMKICYDRVAMVGIEDEDLRITFDSNITWSVNNMDLKDEECGNPVIEKGKYMMEIKVADAIPLELSRKLSELNIFPVSFSKYGVGYREMLMKSINKYHGGNYTNVGNRMTGKKGVVAYA